MILLVIGSVIGSGIFLVPGIVLRPVGNNVPLALSIWFAGGVLSLLGALTYGELSAMKPQAGGLYVYIRDCFGSFPAFLFGWTLFFVTGTGTIATLAVAFGVYLGQIVPISPWMAKMMSLLMIAAITVVNVRGARQSANLQNIATAIKAGGIVLMAIVLLWLGRGHHPVQTPSFSGMPTHSLLSGIGLALVSVLWAYEGWQYAAYSAGEAKNPQRNLPLAFLIGTGALIALYLFANAGYLAALGGPGVAASDRVAATAVAAVIGPGAAKLVALMILIAIVSAANSCVLTLPRVYYAMAADGLFFRRLSEIHPRFQTPAFAIIAGSVWAALLAATGTFEQLLTYVVFIGWAFYALAAGCIFVYRRRQPNAALPYRVPGYPWTPLIFIATVAAFVTNTIVAEPGRAAVGMAVVFAGAPAYLVWRKLKRQRAIVEEGG
ncbi:MAG: amino acid permease [Acidobacteriaceae bacterium]